MFMEFIDKLVEYLSVAFMWIVALAILLIMLFGGKVNVEINGIWGLFK